MTPTRRKTLLDAIDLIECTTRAGDWATDTEATLQALASLGGRFVEGSPDTFILAAVTAHCAWDKGEHLLTRWAANARATLAEGTDDNG
ncbi:MAG: hypothetical protein ACRDBL_04640 [Rhabdaerophilum sp.]